MLARARATHNLLRPHSVRRALTTAANSSSPPANHDPQAPSLHDTDASNRFYAHRSVIVRPWDGISSMPEALALLRAIERRFGRIRDYSILRDPDLPQLYAPFFWVAFRDAESYKRVPATSTMIKVEVPIVDRVRPGGVGLDDLQGLISPQGYTDDIPGDVERLHRDYVPADGAAAPPTRVVEIRIEHSRKRYFLQPRDGVSARPGRFQLREGFYSWGGFAPDTAGRDAPRMRQAREKWEAFRQSRRSALGDAPPKTGPERAEHEHERDSGRDAWAQLEGGAVRVPGADVPPSLSVDAASPVLEREPAIPVSAVSEGEPARTQVPVTEPASSARVPPAEPLVPKLSRRERILAQARENARTPLPASVKATAEEREAERRKEYEEAERVRLSMRDRLFKIIGGKWF
ncbi:hypothetical protein B0H21DRAFT_729166 [Amylocystis lapponica]|nr:hypothetical protein B0H21DRAFT_729166 [Amylocystis lapponica]